jgi:hypothetical protein
VEASVPVLEAAGWEVGFVDERGNPYISAARATMLRKALDAKCDVVVFLDDDLSWEPVQPPEADRDARRRRRRPLPLQEGG